MKDNNVPCVFFSWSGERSKKVAEEFRTLFKTVFEPTVTCFMSTSDISAGSRSIQVLFEMLEKCNYGICFINSENARAPWIQFEAGALSKIVAGSQVMVLLLDSNVTSLQSTPLEQFQNKLFNKEHIKSIFEQIIQQFELSEHKENFLARFEAGWISFSKKVENVPMVENSTTEDVNYMQYMEKDELNTIKNMLVNIQNLLKSEYVGESINLVNELKKIVQNMSSDDLSKMKTRYKVQAYEQVFEQIIQEIEDINDDLECEDLKIDEIKAKLTNIIGRTMSLIYD